MRAQYVVAGFLVGLLLSSTALVLAGNLDPPTGPKGPASQMYTLEQIYDRLDTGAVGPKMWSFKEPDTGPGSTGHTLDEVMELAMTVGNPDPPCFDNSNRYVDCGNGTVHDTVTNLIWLKNADCFGLLGYAAAGNAAAGLEDGECGLTDGSSPGDWRLPTKEEWEATVETAVVRGCTGASAPVLTNASGEGCFISGPQQFANVHSAFYVSSSASGTYPDAVWRMSLNSGSVLDTIKTVAAYVWPVRVGH